jgi:cystathionine gamma-synthase/cystathionine gamma-lyase/cystathionine beta-lyase
MGTLAVHGGERRPGPEGSLIFPIFQGTVYRSEPGAGYHDQKYLRLNNTPTQRYLHDKLAALEGSEAAVAAASGMAAMTATLLALLRPGDHVLAADVLYGGTHDFLVEDAPGHGISCSFIDPGRPETWADALTPRTRMILVETISNPLMRVPRLGAVAAFARERGLVSLIDSTFASPVNCRPVELGFDLVFHSATKYLNGHNDVVAGCVTGSRERIETIRRTLNHYGGSLDPHTAFLLARGLKTLALRVRAHNAAGSALARFLASHPRVEVVNYPGLPGHPDHRHASELLSGFGGMLSFRPRGGEAAAVRLLERLELPCVAPSLGGVDSLVTRPAATSHAGMAPEARRRAGIGEDLIRVSCGVEDPEDLIEDFGRALDAL